MLEEPEEASGSAGWTLGVGGRGWSALRGRRAGLFRPCSGFCLPSPESNGRPWNSFKKRGQTFRKELFKEQMSPLAPPLPVIYQIKLSLSKGLKIWDTAEAVWREDIFIEKGWENLEGEVMSQSSGLDTVSQQGPCAP